MNPIPRICRAMVEDRLGAPIPTERQRKREEKILAAGEQLMAHYGRSRITKRILAISLRLSPTTLTWHYTDIDALLAEILRRHLRTLAKAIGAVPREAPDRPALMRKAYLDNTRGAFGRMSDAHLLLTRDRHLLPEDELEHIEASVQGLAEMIGGDHAEETLDLLDRPWITAARAEPILQTMAETLHHPPQQAAAPAPQPEEPSQDHSLAQAPDRTDSIWNDDLTWLRPAGLGTAGLPFTDLASLPHQTLSRPPPPQSQAA